ncbi:hypothetical protein M426DRAFT_321452 [Hypoxylon sp. CI-4A]|nr:hypothetical protein M426DRAFT_321452 [Hypoxylon sp. CI-4A]
MISHKSDDIRTNVPNFGPPHAADLAPSSYFCHRSNRFAGRHRDSSVSTLGKLGNGTLTRTAMHASEHFSAAIISVRIRGMLVICTYRSATEPADGMDGWLVRETSVLYVVGTETRVAQQPSFSGLMGQIRSDLIKPTQDNGSLRRESGYQSDETSGTMTIINI